MNLPINLRVHTTISQKRKWKKQKQKIEPKTDTVSRNSSRLSLVFDSETTTDPCQSLLFGVFRVYEDDELAYEGIIIPDDISPELMEILQKYTNHRCEGDIEGKIPGERLELISRSDFIQKILVPVGYYHGGTIIGFNLPFDISRIAVSHKKVHKGLYKDGFIFHFKEFIGKDGTVHPDQYLPRIGIFSINSKSSIINFLAPLRTSKKKNRGHFVDCRTLAYALTGESYSLERACHAFQVDHGKIIIEEHGVITPDYVDYCRRDVLATWELYQKLIDEFQNHPIPMKHYEMFSPASLGKGYLKAMSISIPELIIEPSLNKTKDEILGISMQGYHGGRSEVVTRKINLPVVYCDFLSMYPTVNTLMGLWQMLTAKTIKVIDATNDVIDFIEKVNLEDMFHPDKWRQLLVLVCIQPDGDFLPARPDISQHQRLTWCNLSSGKGCLNGLWYALADVIGSKILSGKMPKILQAIRFVPDSVQDGLKNITLYTAIQINPQEQDFFKCIIEERKKVQKNEHLPSQTRDRIEKALKLLANSTSYGIFVEMNRTDLGAEKNLDIYSDCQFTTTAEWYEKPGAYYFPILGTLITAGAHLMLILAQYEVEKLAGIYAFMDTDSIAIVASDERTHITGIDDQGEPYTIPTISYKDVDSIIAKFDNLNPYDKSVVPGSILKIEDENYSLKEDDKSLSLNINNGTFYISTSEKIIIRKQLWCYAISSKRYALFNNEGDIYTLRKSSEHGLGGYISPFSDQKDSFWIEQIWLYLVSGKEIDLGVFTKKPVLRQMSMTKQHLFNWVEKFNLNQRGGGYKNEIKPFNFFTSPLVDEKIYGSKRPVLMAPYIKPDEALSTRFVDLHNPNDKYDSTEITGVL